MKKLISLLLMGFFCFILYAQEEVVFKLSRENVRRFRKIVLPVQVNDVAAGVLRNGDSLVYKSIIDITQPVKVGVSSGFGGQKRVIYVYPKAGQEVVFNASFLGGILRFDIVSGATTKPGSGTVAGGKINKTNLAISYVSTTTLSSDTIRQQWVEKGGKMEGSSSTGAVSITSMNTSGVKMFGGGFQTSSTHTYFNLKIPEHKPGLQAWNSLVYGVSFGYLISVFRMDIEEEGMEPMTFTSGGAQFILSANGGYTLGAGKFKDNTRWKGVAFELTYKPSLMVLLPFEEDSKVDVQLNMAGFGFDINFNSFTSNAIRLAPRAQSKLTFFVLPPIKNGPLVISAGYGRTIYRKIYN